MSIDPIFAVRNLARLLRTRVAALRYKRALAQGDAAGDYSYVTSSWNTPDPALVELRLSTEGPYAVDPRITRAWCEQQTLPELVAVGYDQGGREEWRVPAGGSSRPSAAAAWFAAPGYLPEVVPAHLESAFLVAAAEAVDAVVLRERVEPPIRGEVNSADEAHRAALKPWSLFRVDAYGWDPESNEVFPHRTGRLVKLIDTHGEARSPRTSTYFSRTGRGPYLSDVDLGAHLRVSLRDAALLRRRPNKDKKPAVLVLAPFLARGGAEHTLFETMRALTDRFDFAIATLAPHRPHLGDRREDFRGITERLYCLGDLVHPDAMVGILGAVADSLGAEVIYNANGTTLFYDFAPRLKKSRPYLHIIDHLYDHRVGYIDRYDESLLSSVDVCVAENHRIAEVLPGERGWPASRVPVIWPCGRAHDALPSPDSENSIRALLRVELGFTENDVVFLIAARMHPQKRPLDVVALAERVRDLDHVHFLLVGGGDLEKQVDDSIVKSHGTNIRRLPFRTDVPELILAADIGALVSDFEGLPVFLLECLQLGRPFLGTRVGDLGRILDETGAGIVVDRPGDLDALEAVVRHLADPVIHKNLAENAARAAPRFGVEACADAYARVFSGAR